jgi:tetratricopeptide (TPR) repeat protein/NAD-dependent dihydropyrimidine dehydrogenase PreA subunit
LPLLPPARAAGCGSPRKSTRGKWRALALTLVYVVFAAHYLHWQLAGRTLNPIELSEAMQTLEQGLLNAGFVFFAVAILSTLVLGRWFCGWGCHVVALQDLCTWLLKRLHIRPKPFRSRLLVFVPLLAALYMFVWPTVLRIWNPQPLPVLLAHFLGYWHPQPPPVLVAHFLTYDFWATFPGLWMSLFTFAVCGFLCVILLGNKGFCTYACPYGGFFGVADQLAPGKIRVTDDCDGCGHCTTVCTSNVRVHEEVRVYGMVVNPGCMKCTDCISVCPKEALYFGFGRPTLTKGRPRAARRRRRFDYTWPEELALALLFLVALYAYRGLYDAVPFLLSLGLSALSAFLLLLTARLFYVPSVQLRGLQLRLKGRLTATGRMWLAFALLLVVFVAHSVAVQYHAHEGERFLARAQALQATGDPSAPPAIAEASRAALARLLWVRRYGLLPTAKCAAQLGSLYLFLEQPDEARRHIDRALALAPTYAAARYKLAELLARNGDLPAAVAQLFQVLHDNPALADARRDLLGAARRLQRLPACVNVLADVVRRRPYDAAARLDFAMVLAETGDLSRGVAEIRQILAQRPDLPDAQFKLGVLLAEGGDVLAAIPACERAVALDPASSRKRFVLGYLAAQASRHDLALAQLAEARHLAPLDPDILKAWAAEVVLAGQAPAEVAAAERAPSDDLAARYGLVFLHAAAGHADAAAAAYQRVLPLRPDLPPP